MTKRSSFSIDDNLSIEKLPFKILIYISILITFPLQLIVHAQQSFGKNPVS